MRSKFLQALCGLVICVGSSLPGGSQLAFPPPLSREQLFRHRWILQFAKYDDVYLNLLRPWFHLPLKLRAVGSRTGNGTYALRSAVAQVGEHVYRFNARLRFRWRLQGRQVRGHVDDFDVTLRSGDLTLRVGARAVGVVRRFARECTVELRQEHPNEPYRGFMVIIFSDPLFGLLGLCFPISISSDMSKLAIQFQGRVDDLYLRDHVTYEGKLSIKRSDDQAVIRLASMEPRVDVSLYGATGEPAFDQELLGTDHWDLPMQRQVLVGRGRTDAKGAWTLRIPSRQLKKFDMLQALLLTRNGPRATPLLRLHQRRGGR